MGRLNSGSQQRKRDGCTVSFINDAGEQLTLTRQGPPRESLKQMLDAALSVDATYKVIAYSTPDSILMDINGSRRHGYEEKRVNRQHPEMAALAAIGRKDLCHRTLVGAVGP